MGNPLDRGEPRLRSWLRLPPGEYGRNAPVLFFWAVVLLALTGVGVFSVWTDRRLLAWATACLGGVITIIGLFSIGGQFLFPTLFLFAAAIALCPCASRNRVVGTACEELDAKRSFVP